MLAIGVVFFDCHPIRKGLRTVGQQGGRQVIESALLIAIIVLLMAYLVFALLRPEKF